MPGITRREALCCAWPFFWRPRSVRIAGIRFGIVRHGADRRRYIWIHGNEQTAGSVLREHMRSAAGRAFLIDSTERNVQIGGGQIDPNRMFSRTGAGKSLRGLNPQWTDGQVKSALDILDRDRPKLLDKLLPRDGEILIALHNNGPGYSVQDEVPISDAVSLPAPQRPREFMLCTDPRDFEALARSSYNVVLQNKAPAEDDGSLSRLAASRGIRYVNIEVPHGSAPEQRAMLAVIESLPWRLPRTTAPAPSSPTNRAA